MTSEKDKECKAQWQKDNAEKHRESVRRWSKNNPDKSRAKQRRWELKNPKGALLSRARTRARRSNIEFSLSVSDFDIPEVCPVLGIKLADKSIEGFNIEHCASIDRIDPTKGYVKGNVWVISWRANRLKSDASLEELERLYISVLNKQKE